MEGPFVAANGFEIFIRGAGNGFLGDVFLEFETEETPLVGIEIGIKAGSGLADRAGAEAGILEIRERINGDGRKM